MTSIYPSKNICQICLLLQRSHIHEIGCAFCVLENQQATSTCRGNHSWAHTSQQTNRANLEGRTAQKGLLPLSHACKPPRFLPLRISLPKIPPPPALNPPPPPPPAAACRRHAPLRRGPPPAPHPNPQPHPDGAPRPLHRLGLLFLRLRRRLLIGLRLRRRPGRRLRQLGVRAAALGADAAAAAAAGAQPGLRAPEAPVRPLPPRARRRGAVREGEGWGGRCGGGGAVAGGCAGPARGRARAARRRLGPRRGQGGGPDVAVRRHRRRPQRRQVLAHKHHGTCVHALKEQKSCDMEMVWFSSL